MTTEDLDQLRARERYGVEIAGLELNYTARFLADPVPTGQQIAAASGYADPNELIVFEVLKDGALEEIRPDETVDLRAGGRERFIVTRSDRSFRITINGRRQEWPAEVISGASVKRLAGVVDHNEAVFLELTDQPDREVEDDELVRLTGDGIESFRIRVAREVTIKVNNQAVNITRGRHTGLEIKQAAIAQGVSIQIDFILTLEIPSQPEITIGDTDPVRIKAGMCFTAIANDDVS